MADLRELIKTWRARAKKYRDARMLVYSSHFDECADKLERALAAQPAHDNDEEELQAIRERDHCENVIDRILDIVLGSDRREWSSMYDYTDAIEDVEDRMAALERKPAPGGDARAAAAVPTHRELTDDEARASFRAIYAEVMRIAPWSESNDMRAVDELLCGIGLLAQDRDEARAEAERLRKDAERYRLLRSAPHHTFVTRCVGGATIPRFEGDALDRLTDAILANRGGDK
jgi:hypothetical protein